MTFKGRKLKHTSFLFLEYMEKIHVKHLVGCIDPSRVLFIAPSSGSRRQIRHSAPGSGSDNTETLRGWSGEQW